MRPRPTALALALLIALVAGLWLWSGWPEPGDLADIDASDGHARSGGVPHASSPQHALKLEGVAADGGKGPPLAPPTAEPQAAWQPPGPRASFLLDTSRLGPLLIEANALNPGRARQASLYLVQKGESGNWERYPSTYGRSEEDPDHIEIPLSELRGHWVGTTVEGALTTWFDGDAAQEGVNRIALEAAPLTEVEVRTEDGVLPRDCFLTPRIQEVAGSPYAHLPGPEARRRLIWRPRRLPADGRLRERFPTRAPVRIRALAPGYAADPVELDVGAEGGRFAIVLRPSAQLTVAPRGMGGRGYFQMSVRRAHVPHEVEYDLGKAHCAREDGRCIQVVGQDLGPGAYTVEIEADHYKLKTVHFHVTHQGERIRLEPQMEAASPLGALAIEGLLPAGLTVEDPKHVGLFRIYLRRAGTEVWNSPVLLDESWRERTLDMPVLPAATYDLLLWETQAYNVAFVRAVQIEADQTTRLRIPLEPGRSFSMQPFADAGMVANERKPDDIRIRAPGIGWLPPFIQGFCGMNMVDCLGGYPSASFGPFPVEQLFATFGPAEERRTIALPVER